MAPKLKTRDSLPELHRHSLHNWMGGGRFAGHDLHAFASLNQLVYSNEFDKGGGGQGKDGSTQHLNKRKGQGKG